MVRFHLAACSNVTCRAMLTREAKQTSWITKLSQTPFGHRHTENNKRQHTNSVILRHVRETIVAVEKQ
jgi:hypothetical protein